MEIVIIAAVVIAGIGWWIWKEGQHEKNGHPLENVTKNTATVEPIIVETTPAEIAADRAVETETVAAPKKEKKPAAPKKEKKPAAPKKAAPKKAAPKKPAKIAAAKPKKKAAK